MQSYFNHTNHGDKLFKNSIFMHFAEGIATACFLVSTFNLDNAEAILTKIAECIVW